MPRPFDLCGHDCESGGGFDRGFAAEDGSGDESNDKADGQGLHEGVGHVDEGVLVIRRPQPKARPKEIWPARVLSR